MLFLELPNEIIFTILSFLEADDNPLLSLCLCNKALYRLINPIVYSHVDLRCYEPNSLWKVGHICPTSF
ncbi:hypothetical protein BJX63DRAFT_395341 [Aspergillus granulosus]|uniref:F-box domain-containing protein n=1 Tax=Aspergillus granulosus TaxID=176169 RepID=A0ABR4HDW8_9EURO